MEIDGQHSHDVEGDVEWAAVFATGRYMAVADQYGLLALIALVTAITLAVATPALLVLRPHADWSIDWGGLIGYILWPIIFTFVWLPGWSRERRSLEQADVIPESYMRMYEQAGMRPKEWGLVRSALVGILAAAVLVVIVVLTHNDSLVIENVGLFVVVAVGMHVEARRVRELERERHVVYYQLTRPGRIRRRITYIAVPETRDQAWGNTG